MSYYFTMVPSEITNYYIFIPLVPYIAQIPTEVPNSQNSENQANRQEFQTIQVQNVQLEQKASQNKVSLNSQQNIIKMQQQYCPMSLKPTCQQLGQNSINDQCSLSNASQKLKIRWSGSKQIQKQVSVEQKLSKLKKSDMKQQQYKPFQKRRRALVAVTSQNQQRNIIPNYINQILSYIQKPQKSSLILNRILTKYPSPSPKYTQKRFYVYQSLLKDKVSNYINQGSLQLVTQLYQPECHVYELQEQRYYNRVTRIMITHFIKEDYIFNILTSRRMHKEKKKVHLMMRRELGGKVQQILGA